MKIKQSRLLKRLFKKDEESGAGNGNIKPRSLFHSIFHF
jgi:hypothetical protein